MTTIRQLYADSTSAKIVYRSMEVSRYYVNIILLSSRHLNSVRIIKFSWNFIVIINQTGHWRAQADRVSTICRRHATLSTNLNYSKRGRGKEKKRRNGRGLVIVSSFRNKKTFTNTER